MFELLLVSIKLYFSTYLLMTRLASLWSNKLNKKAHVIEAIIIAYSMPVVFLLIGSKFSKFKPEGSSTKKYTVNAMKFIVVMTNIGMFL